MDVVKEELAGHNKRLVSLEETVGALENKLAKQNLAQVEKDRKDDATLAELKEVVVKASVSSGFADGWDGRSWCLGNLGYDTPASEIKNRANEWLTKCGVTEGDLVDMEISQFSGGTSHAIIKFKQNSTAESMRWILRGKCHVYPENTEMNRQARGQNGRASVFLDHAKSRAQKKPARMTRRAENVLTSIQSSMPDADRPLVVVNKRTNRIFWGDLQAGFAYEGRWHWAEEMLPILKDLKVDALGAKAEIEERY